MRQVENFVRELTKMAAKVGMRVNDRRPPIAYCQGRDRNREQEIQRCLENLVRQKGGQLEFVLFMLRGQADVYAAIKRLSDSRLGFVSQCMLMKHTGRVNPQYLGNILLKINSKLGGKNAHLQQDLPKMDVPTMIVGADVTHPLGGDDTKPSIVAIVASLDRHLSSYTALCNTQPPKCEDIIHMKDMMKELLRRFQVYIHLLIFRLLLVVFQLGSYFSVMVFLRASFLLFWTRKSEV
jgi:eukaryotic translation initiation factor 2C